jgi:hypothetical protein
MLHQKVSNGPYQTRKWSVTSLVRGISLRLVPHERRVRKPSSPARARRPDAPATKAPARPGRRGKVRSRPRSGGDAAGEVGSVRTKRPLLRLLEALEAEKIRYAVVGMAAAIAQGVMASCTFCSSGIFCVAGERRDATAVEPASARTARTQRGGAATKSFWTAAASPTRRRFGSPAVTESGVAAALCHRSPKGLCQDLRLLPALQQERDAIGWPVGFRSGSLPNPC